MSISLANRTARAALDAITALADAGASAGRLRIFSGPVPADADTPIIDPPATLVFEHCFKNEVAGVYQNSSFGFLEYLDQPEASAPKWSALQDTIPPDGRSIFGVNLSPVRDWLAQWPFIDAMRMARDWVPQDTDESPNSAYDTGDTLTFDSDRWPLLAAGKAAATVIFKDLDGRYPAGDYRARWDGTGEVVFDYIFNTYDLTSITPHGDGQGATLTVTPGTGGIFVKINSSDPGDPIRNLRVFMPGFDENSTETFHPDYLASLAGLPVIRFMDWGHTNGSTQVDPADRPLPTWAIQTVDKVGVAVELMAELVNTTGIPGWFCIPHMATDAYVTAWSTALAGALDAGSTVYLEYSNETWNDAYPFVQGGWMQTQAVDSMEWTDPPTSPYTQRIYWYSRRAVQIWAIAKPILETAGMTVRTVMGGSAVNGYTGRTALDFENAKAVTYGLATAPYVGGTIGNTDHSGDSVAAIFALLDAEVAAKFNLDTGTYPESVYQHKADCDARGVRLLHYEAGQHLVAKSGETWTQALAQKFVEVNRDPMMKTFMAGYLAELRAVSDGEWNELLAECSLSSTSFLASTDADPGALAQADAITPDTYAVPGTATFYRVVDSDGQVIWQADTGETDEDLLMDEATFTEGGTVAIPALELTLPETV